MSYAVTFVVPVDASLDEVRAEAKRAMTQDAKLELEQKEGATQLEACLAACPPLFAVLQARGAKAAKVQLGGHVEIDKDGAQRADGFMSVHVWPEK